jgi:hypothetical protein
MIKPSHLLHIDFLSAAGALAWAIAAQDIAQLQALVDYKVAFGFSGVAFGRWLMAVRRAGRKA